MLNQLADHPPASAAASLVMTTGMQVSAELASMTSLAVQWPSSVLVRTDEASLDLMRAMIVGPPDTPYMGGG